MITITPFDDSQQKDARRALSNQSTNTSDFDQYRQGVELTQTKHYTQGVVKIHAGFNGQSGIHTVPQSVYGQTQKTFTNEIYFRDVVPTSPQTHVTGSVHPTYYIVDQGNDQDVDVNIFDGVIEPLHIRDLVALRRDFKAYEHKIWASLGEGNVRDREGSDVFTNIVKFKDLTVGSFAMVDTVDTMGTLVTVANSISVNTRIRGPFIESFLKKGTFSSTNMSNDMKTAVYAMEPPTENMLPDEYTQVGTSGFEFTSDSIAFGDRYYKRRSGFIA